MSSREGAQRLFDFVRGGPARPRRAERLFFALLPDRASAARIHRFGQDLARDECLGGRWLVPERLHVSLHHVGDFGQLRERILYAAERAAQAARMQPFTMIFRSIGTFEIPASRTGKTPARPLVLLEGSGEVLALYRRLASSMREQGLRPSPAIRPHMTLAYGPRPLRMRTIEPIRIIADSFQLIHSERGLTRYNVLGSWPLRAAARPDLTSTLLEVL